MDDYDIDGTGNYSDDNVRSGQIKRARMIISIPIVSLSKA